MTYFSGSAQARFAPAAGALQQATTVPVTMIRIEPNQELMRTLAERLKECNIVNGAIVSVVGAVNSVCISNMPLSNPREDVCWRYEEPLEITGVGEVVGGKPQIHCVLGREDGTALMGRLQWAAVSTWYVNIYVIPAG